METTVKNLADLKSAIAGNPELQEAFKKSPIDAISQIHQRPLDDDKWIYRIVVLSLGITIVSIIIGVLILIGEGKCSDDPKVPTILTAIGSAAIGALSGLLAPSPKNTK